MDDPEPASIRVMTGGSAVHQKAASSPSAPGPGTLHGELRKKHQLTLKHRERLTVEGVLNVENFDSQQILLETEGGTLVIKGEGLHIRELNLEASTLAVEGLVRSLEYTDEGPARKGQGLLGRLLR